MNDIDKLCEVLKEKKAVFTQYEEATMAMLSCEVDDVEQYIIQRDTLAIKGEELNNRIAKVCDMHPDKERLIATTNALINYDKVPQEYHELYEKAQAIRSIGNRVLESDKKVMERMAMWQKNALKSIKQNQNMPKIKKYLTDLTEKKSSGMLRDQKI